MMHRFLFLYMISLRIEALTECFKGNTLQYQILYVLQEEVKEIFLTL